eukprot:GEZU01019584.1.p1 GENE.GEZU01019584.1~~GEZU01019584.1.p1  ORF type:complete len:108 (+),score=22.05 GEZU01019584.1:221-544(+)
MRTFLSTSTTSNRVFGFCNSKFSFWFVMTITAAMSFLINIAMFLLIKYTSPLTNNISGIVKACLQTILGVVVFRNPISFMVREQASNQPTNAGARIPATTNSLTLLL